MKEHIEDILVGGRPMTKLERANKEIERLNNIINEFKKWLDEKIKEYRFYDEHDKADTLDIASYKLEELKGDDNSE